MKFLLTPLIAIEIGVENCIGGWVKRQHKLMVLVFTIIDLINRKSL